MLFLQQVCFVRGNGQDAGEGLCGPPLWHFLFCMLDLLLVLQIINAKANAMRWKNEILTAFLCISSKRFYICTPVSG
jgi:hypothetical protein